jgi:broad specificity phosphatase PhoE
MARLHLIRHGQAAAGWAQDLDPGLSDLGISQAASAAETLAPVGPLPLWSSPLRRTQETAAPLATRWGIEAVVVPEVRELPSPTDDLDGRAAWLRTALAAEWPTMGEPQRAWRDGLLSVLGAVGRDTVVVTHFVVINAVVGAATGEDRVVVFTPGNGSVTTVDVVDGAFEVVALGDEASTEIR